MHSEKFSKIQPNGIELTYTAVGGACVTYDKKKKRHCIRMGGLLVLTRGFWTKLAEFV